MIDARSWIWWALWRFGLAGLGLRIPTNYIPNAPSCNVAKLQLYFSKITLA
jgi:hypothetical protein